MRDFKVMVDGGEAGRIKNGQDLVLDLAAGEHELFLKMDFSKTKKHRFSVGDSEEIFFTCGPGMLGLKLEAAEPFKVEEFQAPDSGLDMTMELNWQTLVVFLLLLAAIGLVVARTYAFIQLERIKTVDHLAFNGEEICVHHDRTLYLLTPGGWLRDRIELADLGISGIPADLEYIDNGRVLIGDEDNKEIYNCDLVARNCEPVTFSNWVTIRDNFKFTYDKGRNVLYVTDTNRHALIVNNMSARQSLSMPGVELSYPNDMALARNGSLMIADTKNSRITSVEIDDSVKGYGGQYDLVDMDEFPEPSTSFAGVESLTERAVAGGISNYPSPLALTEDPDGNWWAIVADAYINYGEIWKFGPDGERLEEMKLSERSIPLDIIQFGRRLLVSDSEENQVYTIDPVAGRIGIFGDQDFQKILVETRETRDLYRQIKNNSFKYIGGVLIALLLMLFVHKRSRAAKLKNQNAKG